MTFVTIRDWPTTIALGEPLSVKFLLTSPYGFARITLDLIGDGQPGWTIVGDKLQYITEMTIFPTRRGKFQLDMDVLDMVGCSDRTTTVRTITVR